MADQDQVAVLNTLYLNIILDFLKKLGNRVVIAVQNISWADEESWSILTSSELACKPSCSSNTVSHDLELAMVFTAKPLSDWHEWMQMPYLSVRDHPCTHWINVTSLSDSVVLCIALRALNATELSPALRQYLLGWTP